MSERKEEQELKTAFNDNDKPEVEENVIYTDEIS